MRPEATFRPGSFPPSPFPRRPSPYLRRQGGTTDTRAAAAAPSRTQSRDRRGGRRYVGGGRLGGMGEGRDAGDRRALRGGGPQSGRTRSTSVEDLLSDQGVPLSIGLQVQPPPATTLADGMTVYVSPPPGVPANGFSVAGTSTGVGVWVVERPRTGSFGKANSGTGEASASAAAVGPSGVTVRAVVTGKGPDASTTPETTGALLTAMGIQPDADDRVVPPPSTPLHDGM